jgi:hypothetical protein
MSRTWSRAELEDALARAGSLVRRFLKGLTERESATIEQLHVHHMAAALTQKVASERSKEPLYRSAKDESGKSVFTIESRYRRPIADFLSSFDESVDGVPRRRRSTRREKPLASAGEPLSRRALGRQNGCVQLPPDAMENWGFWAQLVSFLNEAGKQGRSIRLTTDGVEIKIIAVP